jgi:hypothetical protein
MKTLIIILFISLLAALMMTPSVDVSPGTEVYTHEKMCEKNKTLPECQETEDNSDAIAGIVGQM